MGEKRRWVLLRGLARERGHWGAFLAAWEAALPSDALVAADLPGCGRLHEARAAASIAALLPAVRAQAEGGPVWLLGLSLGGMVVCEWLRCHPDEVAGAVIINSSLAALAPPWRRMRPGALPAVLGALVARDPVARERRIFALTSRRPPLQEEAVSAWVDIARRRPVRRSNALRLLLAAVRYRALPRHWPPLLVLASAADRLVDPRCSARLAAVAGGELRLHPTAGHDLPLDEPSWVIEEVKGWLERLAAAPSTASIAR